MINKELSGFSLLECSLNKKRERKRRKKSRKALPTSLGHLSSNNQHGCWRVEKFNSMIQQLLLCYEQNELNLVCHYQVGIRTVNQFKVTLMNEGQTHLVWPTFSSVANGGYVFVLAFNTDTHRRMNFSYKEPECERFDTQKKDAVVKSPSIMEWNPEDC